MTPTELLDRARISQVWHALGGGKLHRTGSSRWRGVGWYRPGADGLSVALDDERGTWYDHRDSIGGGVLSLIRRVRGGGRRDALEWLGACLGLPLDQRELTPAERREYARLRRAARPVARAAWYWRRGRLAELAERKAAAMGSEHIDIDALAASARELCRLEHLDAEAVVRAYLAAAAGDPVGTAAIAETVEAWDRACTHLVERLVANIAANQRAEGGTSDGAC